MAKNTKHRKESADKALEADETETHGNCCSNDEDKPAS